MKSTSKQKLRKSIQLLLNKAKKAEKVGDYSLAHQYSDDAYFLSKELEALKGF